jgi:hypothetical protein
MAGVGFLGPTVAVVELSLFNSCISKEQAKDKNQRKVCVFLINENQ